MKRILSFAEINKSDISQAGGKGANLGEMTVAGFTVPAGFVVTTAAYDAFVQANDLQQQIVDLANGVSVDDPQSGQNASGKIGARFLSAEIGDELATEIKDSYRALIQDSAQAVAVRSSATAEDLPTASFAGQQDSFLNIQSEGALLDAVKKCWASLWTGRAIAYRQRQGIAPDAVSLAVVVQLLVPADVSGILFTADPTSGERDHILLNATWGLGESIVGGLVTPDTFIIDKTTWEIVSQEAAQKLVMTVRTDTGTEEKSVPADQQNAPSLSAETAVELARIGQKIEAHYGLPMDLEWALADGQLAILQARPITSLPAAPLKNVVWEPPVPDTVWMRRQIVEHMPEPLSPLFEELYVKRGLGESINELMITMGRLANARLDYARMMPHGFATTINGYAYTAGSAKIDRQTIWAVLKMYSRLLRLFKDPAFDWDGHVLPNYQALIAEWNAIDLAHADGETLLKGMSELATADSTYWFGSAPNLGLSRILDPVFNRLLKSFLFRSALPEAGLGSSAFLRGFDSKTLDAQADMEQIADIVRGSESLRDLMLSGQPTGLMQDLAVHGEGRPVLESIERYLADYGHQIYNLDFAAPTQIEDPLPMFLSLKALVETAPVETARVRQAKMAQERDALVELTAQNLNPISRWLFNWVWKWTKYFGPYREHVMFYMGAAWPTVRKLAAELGQRLTTAGSIADPDDIYFLQSSEIETALNQLAAGQAAPDFSGLAQERRELQERRKLLTPLPKVPERGAIKIGLFELKMFEPTPANVSNEGAILNGYAVSTGRVAAPASVIHSIADFDTMQPGSILVCTTTTPAWTPLFSQAAGLVTDVGGALAHGSIVAREYGIPAVMGTGVATERIKSGMMLAIDGVAGTVVLVDEVDEEEEARIAAKKAAKAHAASRKKTAIIMTIIAAITALIWWRKNR